MVNLAPAGYFARLGEVLTSVEVATLRAYLTSQLMLFVEEARGGARDPRERTDYGPGREQSLARQSVHPPARAGIDQTVASTSESARTFRCAAGEPMRFRDGARSGRRPS